MDNQNLNTNVPITPQNDRRGLAIASMVLGIISIVLFCMWYLSLPCAILALIFGALSVKSSLKGMAIAGIVCSIIAIGLALILLATAGAIVSSLGEFY